LFFSENLKQILENFQIKSSDIQISHPDIVNVQTIEEVDENYKKNKQVSTTNIEPNNHHIDNKVRNLSEIENLKQEKEKYESSAKKSESSASEIQINDSKNKLEERNEVL